MLIARPQSRLSSAACKLMGQRLAELFSFVDFGKICSTCNTNCCKRFYAVLLPEEEDIFKDSFTIETPLGRVKAVGARNGTPCPYLDEKGFCRIYSIRPFDCRVWPVLMYYDFEKKKKVIYLDMECPAAAEGKIPRELIEKIIAVLKSANIDTQWLKRYTLAPWPNNLKKIEEID